MIETLLWSEAKETMQKLQDHGPKDLFLDPRIRGSDPYNSVFSAFETGIRTAYVTRNWEPNGRLLHMVRLKSATDRDAVPYDRPVQVYGRRGDFPLLITKTLDGLAFQLEMKIVADPRQGHLAILASSTEMDSEPFQGMAIYHQANMLPDHWVLAIGDGSTWKVTPQFTLPSARPVTMRVTYTVPNLEVDVDGKVVFSATNFAVLAPTVDPLYIGDWIPHMFRTDSPTDVLDDKKYRSPNYWKIQDRRFNGEIISARLMP